MTEMNELTRSLDRVEELIHQDSIRGALTQLNIAYNHALTAVKLIKDQAALLTKQQLDIQKVNAAYSLMSQAHFHWKDRARFSESKLPAEYHMDASDHNPIWKQAADLMLEIERLEYWQNRARSAEAEIKELDEQESLFLAKEITTYPLTGSCTFGKKSYIQSTEGLPVYARPVPAKRVPDGFIAVPINPTDAQVDAVVKGYPGHNVGQYAAEIYRIMIFAKGE